MKRTKRYTMIFVMVMLIFSAASAAVAATGADSVRRQTDETMIQLLANIRKQYPDCSDAELAEILNGRTDTEDTLHMLYSFGIDEGQWLSVPSAQGAKTMILCCCLTSVFGGMALFAVFLSFSKSQKKETVRLASYLSEINRGNYDLKIDENTEDENSMLRNEIYKTTVMLREQSENSLHDKNLLKDSLSDISHQLKTPLTSILIMLDTLADSSDMPEELRREFLRDIKRSANNISFLVQSLLTLSKLDANSIELENNSESVSKIFYECAQNTAVLAELRGVSVVCEPTDILLECDFHWLSEAVSNIIKNCIEHTPEGGTVVLRAGENKLYTKIIVSDNGCGIAAKDLPHIFERFYKGRNACEDSIGIGLALAKTVIEKNGGYITVSSTEGKGTTFVIKYLKIKKISKR